MEPRDMHDEHDKRPEAGDTLPDALRWQLRDLRREQAPARDLWPGIAVRLTDHSGSSRRTDSNRQSDPGCHPDLGRHSRLRGDDGEKKLGRGFRTNAAPHWTLPAALAATLVLALGFLGWQQGLVGDQQATPSTFAATPSDAAPTLVQREAAGMIRQYRAALAEVGAVQPDAPSGATLTLQPAFEELDRNARLILEALAHDPDSRLLLQQLQRTYAHRLALAQRVAIS